MASKFNVYESLDQDKSEQRKRSLSTEYLSIEDKLSKESAKLIKLKVNQEAATWQLTERVNQIDAVRERQHQNLVELQMQYESLSGEHESELRLREETQKKVLNTRAICNVLEEHYVRIAETLSRCQVDRKTLYECYQKAVEVIKDSKEKYTVEVERQQSSINNLEEKIKNFNEQKAEAVQNWRVTQNALEIVNAELKSKLSSIENQSEQRLLLTSKLEANNNNLETELAKEKAKTLKLQDELKRDKEVHTAETLELKLSINNNQRDLMEHIKNLESLKNALINQENFTKAYQDQNAHLEEKMCCLQEENSSLQEKLKQLSTQSVMFENACSELEKQREEIGQLNAAIAGNNEQYSYKELSWQAEKKTLLTEVETYKSDVSKLSETNIGIKLNLESKIVQMEEKVKMSSEKVTELTKDLSEKAETIIKLMTEVKNGTDSRAKLEITIDSNKAQEKILKDRLQHLEMTLKDKDNDLMKMLNDRDTEHDTFKKQLRDLQDVLEYTKGQLENSRKSEELLKDALYNKPQLDENTLRKQLSPIMPQSSINKVSQEKQWAIPTQKPKKDLRVAFDIPVSPPRLEQSPLEYDFFSDSSTEGALMVDPHDMNRRFEAMQRGEKINSPIRGIPIKRRSSAVTQNENRVGTAAGEAVSGFRQSMDNTGKKRQQYRKKMNHNNSTLQARD